MPAGVVWLGGQIAVGSIKSTLVIVNVHVEILPLSRYYSLIRYVSS